MKKIHVGFLLSYDYEKLKLSIPPVYNTADKIFIAEDINKKTWSGNDFVVDNCFYQWLKDFDVDNKIEFYRDNFYIPELSPIENDTRERHLLSLKMGIGNWLIQVDSDEYFIDFESFVGVLRKYNHYLDNPEKNKVQFAAYWLIIYKYTENGILYVDKPMKAIFATNYPNYKCARRTDERVIYTDNLVMHESLSRTRDELALKVSNWGHSDEINKKFMKKWDDVNENNYEKFTDLYYIEPERWKSLNYFPSKNIKDILFFIQKNNIFRLSNNTIFFKNFGQWFKFFLRS